MDSLPQTARAFALAAHGAQRYGDRPYASHLDAVADFAAPYGEEAMVIAYLHDTVEDTALTLDDIERVFGERIATHVGLVTDEAGTNRPARKAKTDAKLARVQDPYALALTVKAADRLANVCACLEDRQRRLWERYRSEHPMFRQAAFRPGRCDALWVELDEQLAEHAFEGKDGA